MGQTKNKNSYIDKKKKKKNPTHSQQLLKLYSFVSKPITDFVHMARPEEKKNQ